MGGGLKETVEAIVKKAKHLKDRHAGVEMPVNYACIFSHSMAEYESLVREAQKLGPVVKTTPAGLLFHIKPIKTVAGQLKLLKIRLPDASRPELGDADFTAPDFAAFKEKYLQRKCFKLIERENYVMIELLEPGCDVRAYFSNPTLGKQLGI